MSQQDKTPAKATGKGQWWLSGKTPDYRFTLANERTFLAWIRTALALLAGAVGIDQFSPHLGSPDMRFGLAMLLVAGGMALSITAWRRWRRNEHAMRLERELPYTRFLFLITGFITFAAIVLALLLWQNAA